nr:zinc finger, CCHC-type [Tanacetum cinerariifolium]
MLMTMEPEIQQNRENLHAHEMLLELKTLFARQAEHELLQTTRDFYSCKQEKSQSVSSYVLKMKGYIDNLECLGHPVTLGLGVSLILIGLRKEFDGFVHNYNMHSLEKTINELHAMLKLHEQTLPRNNAPTLHAIRAAKVQKLNKHKKPQPQMAARGQNHGKEKNKLAYALKPKIPPPPKREDPVKDSIFHECGKTGHWKRNSPQYLAELLKKKKNTALGAGGSGIFVIELNTILNRSWIYDTGCGTHICNTTQGLRTSRKLKTGALSLYVGNGQREVVEAIGLFYLCLQSGLEIVLNSCHYASSITRGVIFVFRLYEDGFINRFLNNKFKAFQKCVSCMSGKMARKPYTHQVERVKDLLGLIHTDVCDLFKIMSRQGANYFITFTDDFSRYPKETMGYSFYYPPKNKVLVARNAEFLENSLISQEASGSLEDLEIIQEEDMHPSIDTSLNHEEDDQEIDEPQSDIVPNRRDLGEPANYKAALLDHESKKWLNVMNVEMQSMKDNEVWVLVELPPNGKTVGSKCLFKKNTDMDGAVHTNKAHLMAKGYTQTPRIDYEEIFSLVADIRAIRILIAIAAYYDYEIWQIDETMGYSFYYPPENKVLVARNAEFQENSLITQEASGNLEDFKIIQEEDMHPSIDTSLNHKKDDQEIDEPQRDIVHNLALQEKTDMDRAVHTYKGRLVTKGYTQTPRIDYEETFSLVADIRAIRILIAIAAYYDYEIWQIDVKTAFLNGYLNEEVYMEQPEVENKLGKTIKALRSDRGGEYISQEFKDYLKACEIVQQLTPPYTLQHNDVSERRNRTLLNMVRSMMSLTTLPLSFWDYSLETAARILNMVWGCEAHMNHHTADKLEQRSVKYIFVGYPKETMGYYFYYPPENKVVVERYADFLEREFILQKESGRTVELDDEDTIPSENTSEHPIEAESLAPIIEEDVVPVRRSARMPKVPNRLCLNVEIVPDQLYFNVEVEEHSLGDKGEPASYKAALSDPEFDKWLVTMNAET